MNKLKIVFCLILSLTSYIVLFSQTSDNYEKAKVYLLNKGEVYFKFPNPGIKQLINLTSLISIDHNFEIENDYVYAYANTQGFDKFIEYDIQYEVVEHPGDLKIEPKMFDSFNKSTMAWDAYPTYEAYVAMMYQFQSDYPNLCRIVDIGTTVQGRQLLFAVISDNVSTHEQEPRFMYTSTMHGDETCGYIMMLRLIDYLLSNYGTNSETTYLVNNIEIWINPLENPDGCYNGGNSTVNNAKRYNANNVDLNRNYKNPVAGNNPDGSAWQPEVLAMVGLTDTLHFVMSANNHGGIELANYPWDSWTSSQKTNADENWWIDISSKFRDTVQQNAPNGYFTGQNNGITHGGDWYIVYGSRQDYLDYYRYGREFTLELSDVKLVNPAELPAHWDYLHQSYLNYMKETLYGFNGIVTDSLTGDPLYANVFINGRDVDNTDVYTELPIGDYYRPIEAGTYSVTYDANGYIPKTISVSVGTNQSVIQNVQLARVSAPIADFDAETRIYCAAPATVQFINLSLDGSSFLWNFGDGNTSTLENPSHTYTSTGYFDVSLTVYGVFGGSDTKQAIAFVEIDASNPCTFNMLVSGSGSSTDCEGILYDSGILNNYNDNSNSTFTISPAGASSITLTFSEFGYEDTYDFLNIYDGPNTTSNLIGAFTGNILPNSGTITSTTGSITLMQTSDQNTNDIGFVLNWVCNMPSSKPIPEFTANKTQTCDGIIEFNDLSTQAPTSWFWDFGDGTSSTDQNPIHSYNQNGIFNVKLVVYNSFGSDSLVKSNFITVDKPIAPITYSASNCGNASLSLSASGAGTLNWYLGEFGDSIINFGTTFQTPYLTSSTNYYVSSIIENPIQNVGSVDYNANGGWHNSGTYYNIFDVYQQLEIVSVLVNKQNAGNITISLLSSTGAVLQTTTSSVPSGVSRINLNFNVTPGTNYGLKVTNGGTLWRNNTGVTMPYEIPGLISITTSVAGSNLYYYLYDWEVREAGCESSRTFVSATINEIPMLDLGNNVSACQEDSVLIVAPPNLSYLWSNGSVNQSITIINSGDYSLTITNENSCSNFDSINVLFNANPIVNLGNDTLICEGTDLLLDAGSGYNYLWSNLANTQIITVSYQGVYSVTVSDINSCTNSDEILVNINPLPVANFSYSANYGEITFTNLSANSNSYYWDFGNSINSNSIDSIIIYTSSNIYLVSLTAFGTCGWDSIEKNINVVVLGIKNFASTNIKFYPNPVSNKLHIEFEDNIYLNNLVIRDITGKVILKNTYNDSFKMLEFDLVALKSGIYLLEINNENENIIFRLIIE